MQSECAAVWHGDCAQESDEGPTSSGGDVDADRLPYTPRSNGRRSSPSGSEGEAEEDRHMLVDDEIQEEEEEEGEDLYPENFMEQ